MTSSSDSFLPAREGYFNGEGRGNRGRGRGRGRARGQRGRGFHHQNFEQRPVSYFKPSFLEDPWNRSVKARVTQEQLSAQQFEEEEEVVFDEDDQ